MKMNKNIVITLVAVLVAGGAGFFGGMKYQEGKRPSFNGQVMGQARGRLGNGNGTANPNGARGTMGEIISSDDKSITVKLADGSSKIVLLSDNTTINKASQAAKSDLTNGTRVVVFGTANSDGSVAAQNIQINPEFRVGQSPQPTATPAQ